MKIAVKDIMDIKVISAVRAQDLEPEMKMYFLGEEHLVKKVSVPDRYKRIYIDFEDTLYRRLAFVNEIITLVHPNNKE